MPAFRAYQDPFLVTSRELLDKATTGPVAAGLLATLKPVGITGLAIVPDSIRYLYSTRPLTTPAQFRGAKIRINVSATTSEELQDLGATPVTDVAAGPAAVRALRDGALTAIEADPVNAMENSYVPVAPYVLVNAPLFAKTSTFAASSAALVKLPAQDAGWLRQAAQQAAASQASSTSDRVDWASMCGQGLRPLTVTPRQFTTLHDAEAPAYADLAGDQETALAVDRIGGLATQEPRMDSWATCHGVGVSPSPTRILDGTYGVTIPQADVVASGDCTDSATPALTRSPYMPGDTRCTTPYRLTPTPMSRAWPTRPPGSRLTRSRSGRSPSPATRQRSCQIPASRTGRLPRSTPSSCSAACSPGTSCRGTAGTRTARGGS